MPHDYNDARWNKPQTTRFPQDGFAIPRLYPDHAILSEESNRLPPLPRYDLVKRPPKTLGTTVVKQQRLTRERSESFHSTMGNDQDVRWSHASVATFVQDMDSRFSRTSTIFGPISESDCSDSSSEKDPKSTLCLDLQLRANEKDLEAGIQDSDPIPELKRHSWLRYVALSMYRRLFSIVFIGNLAAFIYVMIRNQKLFNVINATVANLLALGLARQPLVVNLLFRTFGSIPRSAPLWLRRLSAKIYCYGGVHSGCGVASFVWYVGFMVILTQQFIHGNTYGEVVISPVVIVLSYIILLLLMFIIIAAYPTVRVKLHDYFELTHRFCGWLIVILFWPVLILFSINAAHASQQSLGRFLVTFPTFWMVIITTLAIIHPWLLLRRVAVRADTISTHATRLHFNHTTINFGQGLSLSKHPLKDWHSFATFPDVPSIPGTNGTTKDQPDFSCLISKAGDWTSDTIQNPPTYLWKRAVPIYGFGYVMKVFHRMIVVTTGSGIGPCLGYIGDPNRPAMRVIWQTRSPIKTYGQPIVDLVKHMDPDPKIIDTSLSGKRVDMLPLVLQLYKEFEAEAVCVISNPVMTRKLVFDCEARGVPAFGPIFDS